MLFGVGCIPGGSGFYREITRNSMGTQATHADKLGRVWPTYVGEWQHRCGLRLEGLRVWIHEGGWTPFPFLINYLLSGQGGVVTNVDGRILDRYLSRAVDQALKSDLPDDLVPTDRRSRVEALRWAHRVSDAIEAVHGKLVERISVDSIPLSSNSIDLCHSGGALEHYPPNQVATFLAECLRILRPGGIASHVVDHRDHLHHSDHKWPFLCHLALPSPLYHFFWRNTPNFHNRLSPARVAMLFEEAGFESIAVRRKIAPQDCYVDEGQTHKGAPGLRRSFLADEFRNISEADLRTAAAHYLFRKPG